MATDVGSATVRPAPAAAPSRTSPVRAVWTLVLIGVLVRAWVALAGWYGSDDLVLQGRAAGMPLDADYLLGTPTGHFMPAAAALQWLLAGTSPFQYLPLAALLVAGHAAASAAFAVLALRWWGPRWLVCVPVAVVALSPLTLVTGTSWSAGLATIPFQLALTLLLLGLQSWGRSGGVRLLWAALGAWLLLLGFDERLLLAPWIALGAVPALLAPLRVRDSWIRAMRATGWVWAAAAGLSAAYLALYLGSGASLGLGLPDPAVVADVLARGVATAAAPALVGGPGSWAGLGNGQALADPAAWWVVVALEAVVVLAAASCVLSRRARRTWAWAAATLVAVLAVVSFRGLAAAADGQLVQTLRWTSEAAVPLALALGAGLAAVARRLPPASWRRGAVELDALRRGAVTAVVVVLVLASLVSTARYREVLRTATTRDYVTTATASLAAAADGPTLVDRAVSGAVVSPLRFPYNSASWVFGPLDEQPGFGDPTTLLRIFDDAGALRPALVEGAAASPGPVPGCGWIVRESADIALATPVVDFQHVVRVGFLSTGEGRGLIALQTGPAREFEVERGLSELVITLTGGGSTLKISGLTPGVTLCTDDVRVGQPVVVQP